MGVSQLFISRRLKDRLSGVGNHSITTVIAPMGFGKTTAIKWWSTRRTKSRESSLFFRQTILTDSVTDFWSGFCKMFTEYPDVSEQLSALNYPSNIQSLTLCSEILSNAFSEIKKQVYYILDDFHIIDSDRIKPFILFFSNSLPNNVHLVLLSRNQVFNEMEKLKLGHTLHEISAYDLSLNTNELCEYAGRCGIKASEEELKELASLSEGWFSMIYLNFKTYEKNKKWLSVSADIHSIVNEVFLEPLGDEERDFLILMGICDEFTKEQASYLWERIGSGGNGEKLLNTLSNNNAFISKTDKLYRYHNMLLHCTRHHFSQKPQEYRQNAYTLLGDWHVGQKDYLHAYYAYADANNYEKFLSCIETDRMLSLNAEHANDFFSWIADCPEEILLQHPNALATGMLGMFTFNNIEGLYSLKSLLLESLEINDNLSEDEKNNLLGDAEISESFTVFNNISAMSEYHRRACKLLSRNTYSVNPSDLWTFGSPSVLMLYHSAAGSADSEKEEMKECMPYYYQVTDGHGNGSEHCFAAELHYERGEFVEADILNKMAMSAAKRKNQFSIMLASEFLKMRLELINGNYNNIKDIISSMGIILRNEKQYALLNTLDICRMYIASSLGRPQDTPEWMEEGEISELSVLFPAMPMLHTFYNQLLLVKGEYTAVIDRSEECRELYGAFSNILCSIWLHIQLAGAYEKTGMAKEALVELKSAMNLAMPDNILMSFAENKNHISKSLSELKKAYEYSEYIDKILELANAVQFGRGRINIEHFSADSNFGLSGREFEIAKLAASRMTSAEIAEKLYLSEGTVRNHLSSVFEKLKITGTGKNKRFELEKLFRGQ